MVDDSVKDFRCVMVEAIHAALVPYQSHMQVCDETRNQVLGRIEHASKRCAGGISVTLHRLISSKKSTLCSQESYEHASGGGDTHRRPRTFMHIMISCRSRLLGFFDNALLRLHQLGLGML